MSDVLDRLRRALEPNGIRSSVLILHGEPGGGTSTLGHALIHTELRGREVGLEGTVVVRSSAGLEEAFHRYTSKPFHTLFLDDAYSLHAHDTFQLITSNASKGVSPNICVATSTYDVKAWRSVWASATLFYVPNMSAEETAKVLREHGHDNHALAAEVFRISGGNRSAVHKFIELQTSGSLRSFPWRVPGLVTPARRTRMEGAYNMLPADVAGTVQLLCVAQLVPAALRPDAIARAAAHDEVDRARDEMRSLGMFDVALETTWSTADQIPDLLPTWFEVLARLPEHRRALDRLARALVPGDDQVRIAAQAALPETHISLAKQLIDVARRTRSLGNGLQAARETDIAAQLVEANERGALYVEAAEHLGSGQLFTAAEFVLDLADPLLHDREVRARSAMQRGKAHASLGDPRSGSTFQERAASFLVGIDNDEAARALINAAALALFSLETKRPLRLLERARELSPNNDALAIAANLIEGQVQQAAGSFEIAEKLLHTSNVVADSILFNTHDIAIPEELEHLLWTNLQSFVFREDYDRVHTLAEAMVALADRHGMTSMAGFARGVQGGVAWVEGRYSDARKFLHQTVRAESALAESWTSAIGVALEGSLGTPQPTTPFPNDNVTFFEATRLIGYAMYSFGAGHDSAARLLLEQLFRSLLREEWVGGNGNGWVPLLVECQLLTGSTASARETANIHASWAERARRRSLEITVLRSKAIIAPISQRQSAWETAIAAHERWGNPIELAQTLRAYVEQRIRTRHLSGESMKVSQQEQLIDLLSRAEFLFEDAGAVGFRDRCRRSMAELRREPSESIDERPPLDLRPREDPIVRQVARGATNKEVATSLGLSVKTVEGHLRNIYLRNGIRNRAELVARVRS